MSWTKPLPSSPPMRFSSGTKTSLNESSAVSWPWKPILWSFLPWSKPAMPFSMSSRLNASALLPSPVLTNVTMTSAVLPLEMNVFAPLTMYPPSTLFAVVFVPRRSLPAPGSVIASAPRISPVAMPGSHFSFCSCVPMCTR